MTAVFHDDSHRNLWVPDRRERDKQGVIPEALRRVFLAVRLALGNALDLRRAGLAGNFVGCVIADAIGGSLVGVHHVSQVLDHDVEMLFVFEWNRWK